MVNNRDQLIDTAVSAASELIGFLQDAGPVNSAQARIIIESAVRASVANAAPWEIRDSAKRVFKDLERPVGKEPVQLGLALGGDSNANRSAE
jgi:hypothetical protein